MIPREVRRSVLQWGIASFLGLTLLSYPFFLKFLFHSTYQALVFAGYAVVMLLTLSWGRLRIPSSARGRMIALFLISYGLYLVALSFASFLNAGSGYSFAPLVRALMKFGLGLVFLTQVNWNFHLRILTRYVDLMTLTSAMALILMPLALFGILQPLFTLEMSTASGGESLRSVYPFGMTWGGIWLGAGRILARLQSFADEPGTYAFALLPALAWATVRHRWTSLTILMTALFGTMSAGAIPLGLSIVSLLLWRHVENGKRVVAIGAIAGLVGLVALFTLPQTAFLANYLSTKIEGNDQASQTSLGQRVGDLRLALEILSESPWGLGAGSLGTAIKVPIGIGFGVVLGDSGFLGLLFYVIASIALGAMATRLFLFSPPESSAIGACVLALLIGAMQRAQWDESFWHWWLVSLAMMAFGRILPRNFQNDNS